jgi:thioesterase superfamily protein
MINPFSKFKIPDYWQEIKPPVDTALRTFISGDPEGDVLRVKYYRNPRDSRRGIKGFAWFGPGSQGPPGHAHGGSLSGVLDEAMGVAVWNEGKFAVAANLIINFLSMVRLDSVAEFDAWIEKVEKRKVWTRADLRCNGKHCVSAEGLFIEIRNAIPYLPG